MLKMRSASHATVRVIIAGGGVGGSTPSYSPDTLVHLSQFSRPWLFGQPWDDCRLALAWHAASFGRYVWLMPCYCHRSLSVVIIRQLRAAVSTLANLRLCIHSYRGMWQLIDRLRRKKHAIFMRSVHFMGLLQLRYEHDSTTIRLRFEYDTTSYQELCAFEQ